MSNELHNEINHAEYKVVISLNELIKELCDYCSNRVLDELIIKTNIFPIVDIKEIVPLWLCSNCFERLRANGIVMLKIAKIFTDIKINAYGSNFTYVQWSILGTNSTTTNVPIQW